MKVATYYKGLPTGDYKELPDDLIQKAHELAMFMIDTGTLSIYGVGPVFDLQRQLAEVTRERDTLKAMLDLQNLRADRANLGSGK